MLLNGLEGLLDFIKATREADGELLKPYRSPYAWMLFLSTLGERRKKSNPTPLFQFTSILSDTHQLACVNSNTGLAHSEPV